MTMPNSELKMWGTHSQPPSETWGTPLFPPFTNQRLRLLASVPVIFVILTGQLYAEDFGTSASEQTLAAVAALESKRVPIIAKAEALYVGKQANKALETLETYLTVHPHDIIAGNLYRSIAVKVNLYDRPIRFFVAVVKNLTPCPKDPLPCADKNADCAKEAERCSPTAHPAGPPAGLRYNLAFAYIDKIPVVGPMGAGFLSKRSITQFQKALDVDQDDWIANYGMGMNYLHWPDYFGKNDMSIDYFEKAIAIQESRASRPADILAYVRLGDALAKAGKIDAAQVVWRHGIARLGQQTDFTERLGIAPAKLKQAILDAYNPNNSIGTINTDISILWAKQMPASVFALHKAEPTTIAPVGGQTTRDVGEYSGVRLFNWFRDNLALLMQREHADKINMTSIGATNQQGVGIIAYNMIKGFMTQFRGDAPAIVSTALAAAPDYDRPFFHEGVGMGLAAALDTSPDGSLAPFTAQIGVFDANFVRLHYAGLGMWFGLAPTINLIRIRDKFNSLDVRGQFYAHEGLGFAAALFKTQITAAVDLAKRLPFALASTFAHGAGRGLWIKYGSDAAAIQQAITAFPNQLQDDVRGGFGMGVAFTRIDHLDSVVTELAPMRQLGVDACVDYLVGVGMGLAIRYQTDPRYVRDTIRKVQHSTQEVVQAALQVGMDGLTDTEQMGVEMHQNWRAAIRNHWISEQEAALVKKLCNNTK